MSDLAPDIAYVTRSIKVVTPDGTLFLHVVENEAGFPIQILMNIGKSGSALAAWADAVARLSSQLLPRIGVQGVLEEVSGITTAQISLYANGEVCRSGPEGIAIALHKYLQEWHRERKPKPRPGGPRLHNR